MVLYEIVSKNLEKIREGSFEELEREVKALAAISEDDLTKTSNYLYDNTKNTATVMLAILDAYTTSFEKRRKLSSAIRDMIKIKTPPAIRMVLLQYIENGS